MTTKSKAAVPLEKDFQRVFLQKLRKIPRSFWHKVNDRVTIGVPDIFGCVSGVFIAIELKTRSKVTPLQAHFLREVSKAHGQAFVVSPANADEVLKFLLNLSKLTTDGGLSATPPIDQRYIPGRGRGNL